MYIDNNLFSLNYLVKGDKVTVALIRLIQAFRGSDKLYELYDPDKKITLNNIESFTSDLKDIKLIREYITQNGTNVLNAKINFVTESGINIQAVIKNNDLMVLVFEKQNDFKYICHTKENRLKIFVGSKDFIEFIYSNNMLSTIKVNKYKLVLNLGLVLEEESSEVFKSMEYYDFDFLLSVLNPDKNKNNFSSSLKTKERKENTNNNIQIKDDISSSIKVISLGEFFS